MKLHACTNARQSHARLHPSSQCWAFSQYCATACAPCNAGSPCPRFGLPAPPIPTLCAPTLAPRRGAFDMKSGSIADGRTSGRSSSTSIQAPGTVPGGSQLEALYSDIVLIHRGRCECVHNWGTVQRTWSDQGSSCRVAVVACWG